MASEPRTTRHDVRHAIQRRIAAGAYRPGQKLVQTRLSEEFGVALSVIREALIELHAYGLVEAVDHRGAHIREMTQQELLESLDLREIVEGYAARRCCSRITVQQLRELRQLAADIYREYQQGSRIEAARLDQRFHARLMRIADNPTLNRLATVCPGLGKVVTVEGGDWELAYDGHLRILAAIESGDEAAAERVAREEIASAREQLARLLADPAAKVTWLGPPEPFLEKQPPPEATKPQARRAQPGAREKRDHL